MQRRTLVGLVDLLDTFGHLQKFGIHVLAFRNDAFQSLENKIKL